MNSTSLKAVNFNKQQTHEDSEQARPRASGLLGLLQFHAGDTTSEKLGNEEVMGKMLKLRFCSGYHLIRNQFDFIWF